MSALLAIDIDRNSGVSLTEQIQASIKNRIEDRTLRAGSRLPSSRGLAADLGVSRSVVVQAYEHLIAEGYLTAAQGSGTRVASHISPGTQAGHTADQDPAVRFDLRIHATGVSLFPGEEWLAAYRRAVRSMHAASLGVTDPFGLGTLRTELSRYLGRVRGVTTDPEHLLLTSGFARTLGVLCETLRRSGIGELAVEDPGDPHYLDSVHRAGVRLVPIPVDRHGLDVGALARSGARAVLLTPVNQVPTGRDLSPERREALLRWAEQADGVVTEHEPTGDLWLGKGGGGLAMQRQAPGRVMYAGGACGLVGPYLRVGWLAVPPPLLPAVRRAIAGQVVTPDGLTQLAFADFLASGLLDQHVRQTRAACRARRAALRQAIARHLPGARVLGTEAGTHAYVSLPENIDESELVAAARRLSVLVQGADEFRIGRRPGPPALVIGYRDVSRGRLAEAIAIVGRAAAGLSCRSTGGRGTPGRQQTRTARKRASIADPSAVVMLSG